MAIEFDVSALKRTLWYEYALRFFFGGTVTVVAGLIARRFGPIVGGLFLAFPAIFPAAATLVQKHETEKKRQAGIVDTSRGRRAAALDARGAARGSVALACFALVLWRLFPTWNAALSLIFALAIWMALALVLWNLHRIHWPKKDTPALR